MEAKKVKLKGVHFPHLPVKEINVMLKRELNETGLCFFLADKDTNFFVFLDLDKDSVHLRHVGGAFAWKWGHIVNLCEHVARTLNIKKVSVIADANFMYRACKQTGLKRANNNLFEKVI